MCFSAAASFTTAAFLVPAGLLCLKKTVHLNRPYWVFAIIPLIFGVQQAFEGGVWWALDADKPGIAHLSALGFLFISHFIWLTWIPLSCYFTETIQKRRRFFLLISSLGIFFGASLFAPFLINGRWLSASIINHSIMYQTILLYDDYLPRTATTAIYSAIIIFPLLLSSDLYHKILGILILASMIVSASFFNLAFISVWCYFAAAISLYIFYIIVIKKPVE